MVTSFRIHQGVVSTRVAKCVSANTSYTLTIEHSRTLRLVSEFSLQGPFRLMVCILERKLRLTAQKRQRGLRQPCTLGAQGVANQSAVFGHKRSRGPPHAARMTGSRRDAEFMTEKQ
jgi:hypothetical protein